MKKNVRLQNFRLGLETRRATMEGCNGHVGAVHDRNTFDPWDEREHGWGKVLEEKGFSRNVFIT